MKMLQMEVVMCGMNHLRHHSESHLAAWIWLDMDNWEAEDKVGGYPVDAIAGSQRIQ